MHITQLTELSSLQKEAFYQLWNQEYPCSLRHAKISDLEAYLDGLGTQQHYLLTDFYNVVLGWGFTFTRNQQAWFAIILHHKIQGQGYGRQLLNEIKGNTSELNGWVIDHNNALKENGTPYISPLPFYLKNDFIILHDSRLESEKITAVGIRWNKT